MMFIWNFERMKKMQDVRNLTCSRCIIITSIMWTLLNASLMYCISVYICLTTDPELTHRGEQVGDGQADLGLGAR